MFAPQIEIAVARHFNYRTNLVVPNVSWGLGLRYEADLVVVRPSGWALEVEIKCTASDIKADLKKKKWRRGMWPSKLFREMWFAVPQELAEHPDIPAHVGLLAVNAGDSWPKVIRRSQIHTNAERLSGEQIQKLKDLLGMRVWTLKEALHRQKFEVCA